MLGPRITTVFKSRWNALLWSASILLTAYCSVQSVEDLSQTGAPAAQAEREHVNPWAKTDDGGE